MTYYVTMTDKFLNGWGPAKGKKAKYVYYCETMEEAQIVADNARARSDQSHVNICIRRPRYNSNGYFVQHKTIDDCPKWYKENYFKNMA